MNMQGLGKRGCIAVLLLASGSAAADGAAGATHYAQSVQVQRLLQTQTTSSGDPVAYLQTDRPEVTALLVEVPPGTDTGWHRHPVPAYAYVLSGEIVVNSESAPPRRYRAGEALVEMVGRLHNGRNEGKEPVRILMFVTGEQGKPYTERAPAP